MITHVLRSIHSSAFAHAAGRSSVAKGLSSIDLLETGKQGQWTRFIPSRPGLPMQRIEQLIWMPRRSEMPGSECHVLPREKPLKPRRRHDPPSSWRPPSLGLFQLACMALPDLSCISSSASLALYNHSASNQYNSSAPTLSHSSGGEFNK